MRTSFTMVNYKSWDVSLNIDIKFILQASLCYEKTALPKHMMSQEGCNFYRYKINASHLHYLSCSANFVAVAVAALV